MIDDGNGDVATLGGTVNRRIADVMAGLLLALVLILGLYNSWQAYQRTQAVDEMMGPMMGGSMGGMYGTNPVVYALGTVVVVVLIGGVYLAVRDDLVDDQSINPTNTDASGSSAESSRTVNGASTRSPPGEASNPPPEDEPATRAASNGRRLLDLLPEDERRVLEPVLTTPGITQIELRDRADFSKSKVSQTVSELEKRGLLYRERQGRTYRVYPDESVREEPRG